MIHTPDPTLASPHVTRTPLWLASRRPLSPPRRALILQPGGLGSVMLATPLLAALCRAFPEAQFDWAVDDAAAAAIAGNPRLRRVVRTGGPEAAALASRLRQGEYDTCFLPDRAGRLAGVARRAGIPQRIGLAGNGLVSGPTWAVTPPPAARHRAVAHLALAAAAGVDATLLADVEAEFYPSDADRTAVTRWLVEELDWLGDSPLVLIHPGGVDPQRQSPDVRWPAVRFARLANHLSRIHGARIILLGGPDDQAITAEVAGMVAVPVANQAGRMGLGELGALGEIAGLYVGNDVGPTHVAAAAGCPTLAIFGPTDPAVGTPYTRRTPVVALGGAAGAGAFSWETGVAVEQAAEAAGRLLAG
jgi:ADP-heptose:LPS heptosyltransferase